MSPRRLTLVLAATVAMLALSAIPAAAGGAATVDVTSGLDEPPVAGEGREVRVTLLQHGVTPVDFGTVTLVAVRSETGETVAADATSIGAGAWAATITFPTAGDWQVRVIHNELATPQPIAVPVADPGIALPAAAVPVAGLVAVVLVLIVLAAMVRRPRRQVTGTAAEPSLHRG